MYREKIRQLGSAALARHGTEVRSPGWGSGMRSDIQSPVSGLSCPSQLWIDNMSSAPSHSPERKDSDFFMEHTQVSTHKDCFP